MSVRVARPGALRRVMPKQRQRRPDVRALGDLRPGERPSERRPVVTDGHLPVMVDEVLHVLRPTPGAVIVDGTVGAGGHAEAILHATGGRAFVIGVDRDPAALARAGHRLEPFGDHVRLVRASFDALEWIVHTQGHDAVDGILLDLGMSSMQVDDPARGFSFRRGGPLDMRMDPDARISAMDVVNTYSQEELERVLRDYGQERNARRIARTIAGARRKAPIRTTAELAQLVMDAYPPAARRGTHPARKTFQAIRIEVNGELDALESALRAAPNVLREGGRIVVVSYHSLEDRTVKRVFAEGAEPPPALPGLPAPAEVEPELRVLTRGAILPSDAEVERNPRASAARLRAAEKLPEEQ
jgi:16S rRNA (cytosine1402-N4)-methyltransferase